MLGANVNTEPSTDTALPAIASFVSMSYRDAERIVPRTSSSSLRSHDTSLNRSNDASAMPNTVSVTVLIGATTPMFTKLTHRCASSARNVVMPDHANSPLTSVATSLTAW